MANLDIINRQGIIVVQVSDNQINRPAPIGITSINVIGRNVLDYGDEIGNNFHWLMENFANTISPAGPVDGQLWWDISVSTQPTLRVYSDIIHNWTTIFSIKDDVNPELSADLNANTHIIRNISNPVAAQDAATKIYVDNQVSSALSLASNTFITLTDTPLSFLGNANKILKINQSQSSIIFDTLSFLELNDTPNLYLGAATQVVKVNSAGSGLEFKQLALSDLNLNSSLNMSGYRIESLGDPITGNNAINLAFADNRYLRDTFGNTNGFTVRTSSTNETISRSISAGSGIYVINGSGVLGNPTISHANTSSQPSINNSGNTVIQDITIDIYGHITNIASTSLNIPTSTFNDNRYIRDTVGNTNGIVIRTSSTGASVARTLIAGNNITITNTNGINGNPVISAVIPQAVPAGCITQYAGQYAPPGWLFCDGASISRTTYASLFAVIGTLYGSINTTTFNVPNMGGRMPLGVNNSHALGTKAGEESHTLIVNEIPSHKHTTSWGEYITIPSRFGYDPSYPPGIGSASHDWDNGAMFTSNTGGSMSHNNMPPFITLNNIIKI